MAFSFHFSVKQGNLVRFYSRIRNPYDVLGLKHTCSPKDVKKAYIKLCKELHPDMKPGDASQHKKFIELNDAYTALINSENKRQEVRKGTYNDTDFSWIYRHKSYTSQKDWESHAHREKAWYETEEYQQYFYQRDKKNVRNPTLRISNLWVVTGCFMLMIIGSVLYITAYRYACTYKEDRVDSKSRKISENYDNMRKNILEKGRTERLCSLQKKWND